MPDFFLLLTPHDKAIFQAGLCLGIAAASLFYLVLNAVVIGKKPEQGRLADSEFVSLTKIVVDALNGFGERLNDIEECTRTVNYTPLTPEQQKADEVLAKNIPGYTIPKFENTDALAAAMRKQSTRSGKRLETVDATEIEAMRRNGKGQFQRRGK